MVPDYGHTHTKNNVASVNIILIVAMNALGAHCCHVITRMKGAKGGKRRVRTIDESWKEYLLKHRTVAVYICSEHSSPTDIACSVNGPGVAQIPAGQVMPLATQIHHDRRIGNAITVSSEALLTRVRCSDVENHSRVQSTRL